MLTKQQNILHPVALKTLLFLKKNWDLVTLYNINASFAVVLDNETI